MAKANPSKTLVATAYHEAGHAVIAWANQIGLREASIIPNSTSGTLGHCRHATWPSFRPDTDNSLRTRRRAEMLIMVALAGSEAEKRVTGRYNHRGAESDMHYAGGLTMYLTGSAEEAEALLRWLTIRTRNVLENHWSTVEPLADALLNEQRLNGKRILEVILATMGAPLLTL